MLNHIVIMGRLTRDPELRHTQAGTAVASFTVAVDRDYKSKETGEREKALNEMIKTLKKASLDKRSREITDIAQLQKLIEEKKKLEHLHITIQE